MKIRIKSLLNLFTNISKYINDLLKHQLSHETKEDARQQEFQ